MPEPAGRPVPDIARLHDAARTLLESLDAAGMSLVTSSAVPGVEVVRSLPRKG